MWAGVAICATAGQACCCSQSYDTVATASNRRISLHRSPQALEKRSPAGRFLSAPVLAMLLGMAAAAAGLLPSTSPAYEAVFDVVVPLACALCLLEADVSRCAERAIRTFRSTHTA